MMISFVDLLKESDTHFKKEWLTDELIKAYITYDRGGKSEDWLAVLAKVLKANGATTSGPDSTKYFDAPIVIKNSQRYRLEAVRQAQRRPNEPMIIIREAIPLKMLSLFSGIGGLDLAAEWAGIETVMFCERDKFCQQVLKQHWPNVPIVEDVRNVRGMPVDVVTGGYPCQPFSTAGKRGGEADERHLWPEMLRIVRECRPAWVIGENVKGHLTLGHNEVCNDLEREGYETRTFVLPAVAVGAPHKRERVFIVAYSDSRRRNAQSLLCSSAPEGDCSANVDSSGATSRGENSWLVEPNLVRVVYGGSRKLDKMRVKSLGNMVVPQQAYPIFNAIAKISNGERVL
jgi:DNA (cytosine-5)-methyltransferase 1